MTTAPTITVRMAITIATIGRLMKNLDMAGSTCVCERFRIHLHSLANLLHAFGHHALARLAGRR